MWLQLRSQNSLGRQVVGLIPCPPSVGPGSSKHCKCGQPQGVAHTTFKCPKLVVQRQSLISALDGEGAGMAQDSAWGNLTDAQKLAQSFCPSKIGTLSAHEVCTFYSECERTTRIRNEKYLTLLLAGAYVSPLQRESQKSSFKLKLNAMGARTPRVRSRPL